MTRATLVRLGAGVGLLVAAVGLAGLLRSTPEDPRPSAARLAEARAPDTDTDDPPRAASLDPTGLPTSSHPRDGERIVLGHELLSDEVRSQAVLGGKESSRASFCDDAHWPNLAEDEVIHEIGNREIRVDPALWDARRGGRKLGLARWASACLFGGAPLAIRDAATGVALASYSREHGYSEATPNDG